MIPPVAVAKPVETSIAEYETAITGNQLGTVAEAVTVGAPIQLQQTLIRRPSVHSYAESYTRRGPHCSASSALIFR
jgi:hypothetical protein